jgi:hypothetical protein
VFDNIILKNEYDSDFAFAFFQKTNHILFNFFKNKSYFIQLFKKQIMFYSTLSKQIIFYSIFFLKSNLEIRTTNKN